jgi:hypothetical protein
MMLFVNTAYDSPYPARQFRLTLLGAALILPLVVVIIKGKKPSYLMGFAKKLKYTKHNKILFILSGSFLTALTGLLIPSTVIKTSPSEFIDAVSYRTPNYYIVIATLLAAGVFLVWGGNILQPVEGTIQDLL